MKNTQQTTGKQVACLEEIAYEMGYITKDDLVALGKSMEKTQYGKYILSICE